MPGEQRCGAYASFILGGMAEGIMASKCTPLAGKGKLSLEDGFINVSLEGLDCGAYLEVSLFCCKKEE